LCFSETFFILFYDFTGKTTQNVIVKLLRLLLLFSKVS